MRYDALLLDYDGVVVRVLEDGERLPAFYEALAERFQKNQLDCDEAVVKSLGHGVSPEELRTLSEQIGLDVETLWRLRDDSLADVFRDAARAGRKVPYDDVAALFEIDLPVGIASNNQQRVVEFMADEFGLCEHFQTIHARDPHPDSLHQKKPEPHFIEAAIADLGVENPLYVGDKETDIIAGQRVGLDTALIRRSHNASRAIQHDPTYEVGSLETLVDILISAS